MSYVLQPSGVSSAAEAEDDPEVPLDELKVSLESSPGMHAVLNLA